ncbi:uncharacterized protein [Aristolochia californica]|uniref:uncharacterized protein n=1 Tax=Aristolochia californica TaxID=171875 RepID=UPI0035E00119
MDFRLLEINLISAQNLTKPGATNLRRLQTYAVAWVDPSAKLRTRVDQVGFENPTWNDKFIFRVTPQFLASESSAVSVEIYFVGYVRDTLIGTVRFLLGSHLVSPGVPSFSALQIRCLSSRFDGILNIGAVVLTETAGHEALLRSPALGFQDLMGKNRKTALRHRQEYSAKSNKSEKENISLKGQSDDETDHADAAVPLNDRNGRTMRSILCKLGLQRKESPLRTLDENRTEIQPSSDYENRRR